MTNSSAGGVGLHFLIATGFAIWVIIDSLKRGKLAWVHAIISFLWMWCFCLPFYFAGRKLLPGETREGGYWWNVCKFFLLLWSFLLGYCLVGGMVNVSNHLDGKEMDQWQSAGATIGVGLGLGMFFCLWVGVALPVFVIGLLLKKNTVVEKGEAILSQNPVNNTFNSPQSQPVVNPASSVTIHIARQGKIIGYYDLNTFKQMVQAGAILPTDNYWIKGTANWDIVSNFRG
jgi:hypothetical protein